MMTLVLILSFLLAVMLILGALAYASIGLTAIFGAPWVPTPKRIGREMLRFAEVKPGERLLDIGCGEGVILRLAVREFDVSKAIGIDINPFLIWIGKRRAQGKKLKNHVELHCANAFNIDLPQVDVIALYLLPAMMDRLVPKLKTLDPSTRIVSRGFEFSRVRPYKTVKSEVGWLYLYTVEDLVK